MPVSNSNFDVHDTNTSSTGPYKGVRAPRQKISDLVHVQLLWCCGAAGGGMDNRIWPSAMYSSGCPISLYLPAIKCGNKAKQIFQHLSEKKKYNNVVLKMHLKARQHVFSSNTIAVFRLTH